MAFPPSSSLTPADGSAPMAFSPGPIPPTMSPALPPTPPAATHSMHAPSTSHLSSLPTTEQQPATLAPPPLTEINLADLCPLCPNARPPSPLTISVFPSSQLAIPSSALNHPSFPPSAAGPSMAAPSGNQTPPELCWIACTRCKVWYHSVCLLLVTDKGQDPRMMSVPKEIVEEVGTHRKGVWWDWTGRVDRWYCPSCIHSASLLSARSIPHATLKKHRAPTPPTPPLRNSSYSDSIDIDMDPNGAGPSRPRSKRARTTTTPFDNSPLASPTEGAAGGAGEVGVNGNGNGHAAREGARPKRKAAEKAPDYLALHNHISTPTGQWLELVKNPKKTGRHISEEPYVKVHGSLLTKEWMESETEDTYISSKHQYRSADPSAPPPSILWGANREPLIIPADKGGFLSTGGKLPSKDISIVKVAELVGKGKLVDVIDVATQRSSQWTLERWAEYVSQGGVGVAPGGKAEGGGGGTTGKGKVFNVISLEISGTPLAKQVKPPKIVSEIDWVDNFWPDSKKSTDPAASAKLAYPKVQLYCLMGMQGSWTDWHVDFAASSVYYTVVRGAKTFFFIRPTEANLAAYAKWSGDHEAQEHVWLGDWCDEVRKVTLEAGDTMIIPTGYIHAVYTPKDSLVFGGNYLHSYNIETQLRLRQIEIDTKVPQRFRFPFLERLCWYVADAYIKEMRQMMVFKAKSSEQRVGYHPRVLEGLQALAGFLIKQCRTIEKGEGDDKSRKSIFDRIPLDAVKDAPVLARELKWRAKELLGVDSDDEQTRQPVIVAESKRGKKRKGDDAKPIEPAVIFAPTAMMNGGEAEPWETLEGSVEPVVSIVQRARPAIPGHSSYTGRLESAVEETTSVRQRRRAYRSEGKDGIVEETQEVSVLKTVTRWTSDKKVVLQAAQKSATPVKKEGSVSATAARSDSVQNGMQVDASSSEDTGPQTPISDGSAAPEQVVQQETEVKLEPMQVDGEVHMASEMSQQVKTL